MPPEPRLATRGRAAVDQDASPQGVRFVANVREQQLLEGNATTVVQPGLTLPDMPSIAVLPFQDMSGDPGQDYFADGVVEEIITALSRFRQLFVIARNSSFTYKGRSVDVKQVGRELGVRYVLEVAFAKPQAASASRRNSSMQSEERIFGRIVSTERSEIFSICRIKSRRM